MNPQFGERKRYVFFVHIPKDVLQDVLILLELMLALLMEGILEDCQGWEVIWTKELGSVIDKVVSIDH